MSTLCSEPCKPDIGYFFDNSKCKPGKQQILKNCIEFEEINMPWLNQILTDDEIRIEMKKIFIKF